jgi:hypothetical protein
MTDPIEKDWPLLLTLLGVQPRFLPELDDLAVDEQLLDRFVARTTSSAEAGDVAEKIQTSRSWYRAYARRVAAGLRNPKA